MVIFIFPLFDLIGISKLNVQLVVLEKFFNWMVFSLKISIFQRGGGGCKMNIIIEGVKDFYSLTTKILCLFCYAFRGH